MKIKNSLRLALALGATLFVSFATARGQTAPVGVQYSLYGVQFVAAGQSLRVGLLNQRFNDLEIVPCIRVRVVFDVYEMSADEPGRLRLSRRVSREALLDAGEAVLFDFPASRADGYVGTAVFSRPEDREVPDGARLRLTSTLGVRESGRTILNLPAVEKGFDPQPDPPVFNN